MPDFSCRRMTGPPPCALACAPSRTKVVQDTADSPRQDYTVPAGGARTLSSVTEAVVSPLPEAERFSTAGRVAEVAARLAKAESARERPWTRADEGIWIEEWSLTPSANEG